MPKRHERLPWFQRLGQYIGASRPGAWVFSRTLHHVDRVLLRLTGGRLSLPTVLAGLPVIRLTTTGAKTGRDRTVPVLGLRDGERWVLVASNWGQPHHPAWYHNLSANPEVRVTHEGETRRYRAREVTGEERAEYWERATDVYLGFEPYRERVGDRDIPVVVLEPAPE